MRRSTPPAVVFPREWTSGGTATRTAERERTIRSQRGFAIHGDGKSVPGFGACAHSIPAADPAVGAGECSKGNSPALPGVKIAA